MTIDYLDQPVILPFDRAAIVSGDPEKLANYLYELVKDLENRWIQDIHTTVNWILDLDKGPWLYFSTPDTDGVYAEGTWRLGVVDENIEMQKLISGTWTKNAKWKA